MREPPIMTPDEAVADIADGSSIFIGGFSGGGQPFALVEAMARKPHADLTLIANNFSLNDNNGVLVASGGVIRVIASFPVPATSSFESPVEAGWKAGIIAIETVPQGTLTERIRAAGAGIGGFYTPTGVGTVAAEGKEVREIDGKQYIFERPLAADVAFIKAWKADKAGNLVYRRSARNFNPIMATAAKLVICEVEHIVETGEIEPEHIVTPGIYVDRLVPVGAP